MPGIDAIFLDLDGTLLTSDKEVDPVDRATLLCCLDAGIQIILVSGRPIFYVESVAKMIDSRIKCMGYNGAFFKDEHITIDHCFTKDHLHAVRKLLDEYSLAQYYLKGLKTIYSTDSDQRFVYPELQENGSILRIDYAPFLEIDQPVYKVMVLDSREDVLSRFEEKVKQFVSVTSSHKGSLDVMEKNVNKGKAIDILIQTYHWSRDRLMAFGDAVNDLDMFKKVKYSIAMGNGANVVKQQAWSVTDSHDENGITKAILKIADGL